MAEETAQSVPLPRTVTAAVGGIATAWIVAGSAGLLVRPLQHALAWVGIGVVLAAGWPRRSVRGPELACLVGSALAAVMLCVPAMPVYNLIGVALVLAAVAWTASGVDRKALLAAAYAVAVLAIYRLAMASVAVVWVACNAVGEALGAWAGAAYGKPLSIGATFAGLDFLVLMAALGVVWLLETAPPRLVRALCAAAAVCCGHAMYLFVLAHSDDLLAAIPKPPPVEPSLYQSDLSVPAPWYWGDALRTLLPWNLPLLALAVYAAIAAAMFRWSRWTTGSSGGEKGTGNSCANSADFRSLRDFGSLSPAALGLAAVALAAFIPVVTSLSIAKVDLSGRKIAVYDHGSLDWGKPQFDRYGQESAGHYGMLPTLVACLGGRFVHASNLGPPLLDDADVLVLIHPTRPWTAEQIDRVWDYVRRGGSLLVVAEPRIQDEGAASSFNDLLAAIGMEVRFDTATAIVRHWQHGLEPAVHPAAVGIDDESNGFALAGGSSIRLGWTAQPILIGRWGWSDPGSDAALTGVSRLDCGERLGDLVLAAEQGVGQGRVIVLADASALKNVGLPGGYEFAARLLGYLAAHASSPQLAGWRQFLGFVACLGLVGLLGWQANPGRLAAALAMLALFLSLATALSATRAEMLLDGREQTPNPVACIDASHLPAAGGESWGDDGLAGLELTLMRNGYLPIVMRRWSDEQLQRAGMLIAVAPARAFSAPERAAVRRFLEQGGAVLCTAGANHAGPIQSLLAEFDLSVPLSPLRPDDPRSEPTPMGFFRTPYLDTGKYKVHTGLYAGWPVAGEGQGAEVLVRGFDDLPVAVSARVGRGKFFLFGDTYFAANKNLESEDGRTDRIFRENAHFWRWFFGELNDRKFIPPEPPAEPADSDDDSSDNNSPSGSDMPAGKPEEQVPKPSAGKEAKP